MHDTRTLSQNFIPAFHGRRLWFPLATLLLAALGIAIIRLQPDLEYNFKSLFTFLVGILAVLLGLVWFFFLSRVGWRSRVITLAVLALSIFGLTKALRVDGTVDGTGFPKLAWRWTPIRVRPLSVPPSSTTPGVPVPSLAVRNLPDVPQFFGASRDGVAQSVKLARDWNATPPRLLWRQPAGAGWSAFAVVGGRAFTQEQLGEDEAVTCYDLLTGRLLWSHSNTAHFKQWQGGDGPRATPTVQGGRVFAIGATGILDCLDAATGRRIWSRDVLAENKLENLIWGVSASPLVFDETVIVTGGLTKGPSVLAYRKSDGEPLWRSGEDKASYASPTIATLAGRRVILSVNAATLTAHDPANGRLLLSYPFADDKWPKASQPVVLGGDRVFLSAGYGAGCALLEIKAGADGKLVAGQLWKNLRMKTQFNSAAARDGFLYGLDDGLLACVEISSGERKWKGGRYGSGQTLLVDDLIIVQGESGAVALAEAQPGGFKELGRIPALGAKTWNHPTLVGRYLLVRNSEEMACYELPLQPGEAKTTTASR
jgi:outer membrane protein assembly factor BamB